MAQASKSPIISGPIEGGVHGWPFSSSMLDVASLGYTEAEYFIEGDAQRYRQIEGSEWGRDGFWQVEPTGNAAFKTRLLVYRPTDHDRFNGMVIATWNNVTAGYELFGSDSLEIFEGGYALVCASVQRVGIEGLPPVRQGLADWDPERYGSLSIPGDDYSFDIFTQIGESVGPGRDQSGCDPMSGLLVARVMAQGASQSAGRLGTYVNAIAPLTSAFDGFVLGIYFGRGTPIEVGDAVMNINAPADDRSPGDRLRGTNLLRDDIGKPVFIVNSELEAMACYGVRQPDSDTLRWWESAGTCHVSQQSRAARQLMAERDQLVTRPGAEGINAIPIGPLYDAAYYHMHRWLRDGVPPPIQDRIEFSGPPPAVVRDEDGIATGGIRLPQADVPVAQNSAIPLSDDIFAVLGGSSHPFTAEKVRARYGDRTSFLQRFENAARAAVDAGVLRPREVERLLSEAAMLWPE
jgi:hypothetical protein